MILPILLILVALAVERGVTLWSVSEQVAQSRTQAEEQFLTLFPEQKRIVNLRSQVTMALKKYRPQADDTRLLAELSAIASTLKSASLSDIEMRGFTFDQNARYFTSSYGPRTLPVSTNCVVHWQPIMLCNRTRYRKRVMRFPAA